MTLALIYKLVVPAMLAVLASCNDTRFASGSRSSYRDRREQGDAEQQKLTTPSIVPENSVTGGEDRDLVQFKLASDLKVNCQQNSANEDPLEQEIEGSKQTMLNLAGEFCGDQTPGESIVDDLSAFFMVDESVSMNWNDPVVNGSCGRLAGVRAALEKLEAKLKEVPATGDKPKVRFGALAFSKAIRTITPLSELQAGAFPTFSTANFCMAEGSTNYEGAFLAAHGALKSVTGKKSVYFVSDGLPTVNNSGTTNVNVAETSGKQAADKLRQMNQELMLKIVFLQTSDPEGREPRPYLESLTDSPKDVAIVTDTSGLADGLVKTTEAQDLPMSPNAEVEITVSAEGFESRTYSGIKLVASVSNNGKSWQFKTEKPIELFGSDGRTVINEVVVKVKNGDRQHSRKVVIRNALRKMD